MRIHRLLGVLFLASYLYSGISRADVKEWTDKGWEFLDENEGIRTYRKSFPDSPVKGVAGEAEIDAPLGKILWVLMDHEHKGEWIEKFKEAYTVDEQDPLHPIQYAAFDMPFPVADRDFVYRFDFKVDPILNAVIVDVKSVENSKVPPLKDGSVRGEVVMGRYVLIPHGDKTFVQAEYLADAKGSLPTWIVNFVQKRWPFKTLTGLRLQVKKDFVKTWPVYESELKSKLKPN